LTDPPKFDKLGRRIVGPKSPPGLVGLILVEVSMARASTPLKVEVEKRVAIVAVLERRLWRRR